MRINDFEWDKDNINHIRMTHGVEPYEAEEVFVSKYVLIKAKYRRYNALGYTINGRLLSVIFEYKRRGVVRVVTARDMTDKESKYFRKKWRI